MSITGGRHPFLGKFKVEFFFEMNFCLKAYSTAKPLNDVKSINIGLFGLDIFAIFPRLEQKKTDKLLL